MESRDATRSSVDMGALLGNTSNSLGHAANEEDGAGIGDLVEVDDDMEEPRKLDIGDMKQMKKMVACIGDLVEVDDDVEELQKLDMARILLKTS